jgi:hypothetical protein
MRALAVPLLLVLAAAPAASRDRASEDPQAALTKRLAGLTPGHPISCLPNSDTRFASTHAYGRTIVYEVSRNFLYRTDTAGGCESMAHGDYIVVRSNGGQVCKGDIGQTFDPVARVPTGSCALGEFTPYRRP